MAPSRTCPLARVVVPHPERARSARFDPLPEASSLILIFPLSSSGGGQLRAGHRSVTEGRLAPPESDRMGVTCFWEPGLPETGILRSERNGRLLHGNSDQKMTSECTNFPYASELRKTAENRSFPLPRVVAGRVKMAKTVKR